MLKLLLRLWADQKRRNFKWGKFFGQLYFFGLSMIFSIIITFVSYANISDHNGVVMKICVIAVAIIVPDFLYKMVMKNDETVMDHYLKSKPIPERSWNRFLLVCNLVNYWNWAFPILLLPFCILFLKWFEILPSFLLLLAVSMVDGVAITAFRRAKGWTNKWPVLAGMVVWFIIALVYALTAIFLPWGVQFIGFFLLCVGAVSVFYNYLCKLRRYNEEKTKANRLLLSGKSSLFSMEYISVLRSKRLRIMLLAMSLLFVFNCYIYGLQGNTLLFYTMLMFAVFAPSLTLGQWVFGIEGNYFDGLWTKPVNIRTILINKYRFFALLNLFPIPLLLPLIWVFDLSPWVFPVTWLYCTGLVNSLLMPTALISSRVELFQSGFFNFQGASLSVNMYGFISLIPVVVYALAIWLLPLTTTLIVLTVSGAVGIALHQAFISWIARRYEKNRYKCFERYRS